MDKKYQHLSKYERYYISKTIANTGVAEIAKTIGYHRSTIYRELKRNSDEYGSYTVSGAMQKVNARNRDKYERFAQITDFMKTKISIMLSTINYSFFFLSCKQRSQAGLIWL